MTRIRVLVIGCVLAGCASANGVAHDDATGSGGNVDSGGSAAASGHAGHGFVAGGIVAKSASYRLVGTLTTGTGTSASAHDREQGGVLGATQK